MISPDHPTFLRTKVHTHGNVPVAMAGTGIAPDEFTSLRRHERGQLEAGLRRRLADDGLVHREELKYRTQIFDRITGYSGSTGWAIRFHPVDPAILLSCQKQCWTNQRAK